MALVDASPRWPVTTIRNHSQTLRTVSIAGKVLITARHRPAVHEQLRAVLKGVLHRIRVKILVHAVATIVPTTGCNALHRPRILHPAALINVVNQEVTDRTTAEPQKCMKFADLPQQLTDALRLRTRRRGTRRTSLTVSPQGRHFTNLTVLNSVMQLTTSLTVTAHQTNRHLQILLNRFFIQCENSASRRAVHCYRLLHEHIQTLLNCIGVHHPAKGGRSRQDHDVPRLQTIHRLLVGIKTHKSTLRRNIHLPRLTMIRIQTAIAAVQILLEHISHRHQLQRPVVHSKRICHCPGATTATAHQRQLDRVVFRCIQPRCRSRQNTRGSRCCR